MTLGLDFLKIKKQRPSIPLPPQDFPMFPSPKEIDFELQPSMDDLKEASGVMEREPQTTSVDAPVHTISDAPVYLKINAFKEVLAQLQQIRSSLDESESKVVKLEENDKSQEREYRDWHDAAKNMHEKFMFIDETLFKR